MYVVVYGTVEHRGCTFSKIICRIWYCGTIVLREVCCGSLVLNTSMIWYFAATVLKNFGALIQWYNSSAVWCTAQYGGTFIQLVAWHYDSVGSMVH